MRGLRFIGAFILLSVAALAQRQMTVAQLVSFIKSSIQMHQDDRKVADMVKTFKLTNKLEDQTVEDLQNMGAGPRTVAALRALTDATASLTPPPPPEAKPVTAVMKPPADDEQKRILAELRDYALNYTKNLPNFICTQVTRRHEDPSGKESWVLLDTVQEHLSYVDHHEDYKVVMVNNKPVTNVSHTKLGGNTSSGEFGTMLSDIFDPESHAEFTWDHWGTLRKRLMYVFSFRVPQEYSRYSIYHQPSGRTVVPGYHGLVYADKDTGMVMRIVMECERIPADFPVQEVREVLDYDFVDISGHEFVLPLKADLHSREARTQIWNELEFHLYRKFGAESNIVFDAPDAIPEDQLKEQPVK